MPRSKTPALDSKAPAELDLAVGRTIRKLRKRLRISQAALGQEIGVTFQQVQKYEVGRNRVTSSRLQRIADALQVPVTIFFSAEPAPTDQGAHDQSAIELAARICALDAVGRRAVEAVIAALEHHGRTAR